MAEGLLKKMLTEFLGPAAGQYEVNSAGVAVNPGDKAADQAIEIMAEAGIDLSAHRATQLTPDMAAAADLILTMTAGHKQSVLGIAPAVQAKVYTLKEYVQTGPEPDGGAEDIADPYNAPAAVYRSCAGELKDALERLIRRLGDEDGG